MGGRSSSSGMGASRSGGGAMNAYNEANQERERLASIRPSQRTPEQNQQLNDAINRQTNAAYGVVSNMSDSQLQSAVDKFIKSRVENQTETDTEMRKWIRSISGTKRDGSPTKSSLDNASSESVNFISSRSGLGLYAKAYSDLDHPTEAGRIGRSIVNAAKKYRDRWG